MSLDAEKISEGELIESKKDALTKYIQTHISNVLNEYDSFLTIPTKSTDIASIGIQKSGNGWKGTIYFTDKKRPSSQTIIPSITHEQTFWGLLVDWILRKIPHEDIIGDITTLSPNLSCKKQAWNQWLETTGAKLGRKEDDIQIIGDVVTVKIPGYKDLVFNPSTYKFGGQQWKSNDTAGSEEGSGNKFSKEDFEQLIKFVRGNNSNDYWRLNKEAVAFFTEVLGLKLGIFYWSSSRDLNGNAWGLHLNGQGVVIGSSYQGSRCSGFSS